MTRGPAGPPPLPDPLPVGVVDDHTHLEHVRAGDTDVVPVAERLAQAVSVNVTRMVQVGCELDSARWTAAAVTEHPELLGAVAIHPTEASKLHAEGGPAALHAAWAEIAALAAGTERIRAIGETGLDLYWVHDEAGLAAQVESFRAHVAMAKELGLVLQVHDRDAHREVLEVLEADGAPQRTVMHCFSGDAELAARCTANGWYLSFAGTVTFANAEPLRQALRVTPPSRVLVETDAPYLTPHPWRGRVNSPALLPWTVRTVAGVLGLDLEQACHRLDDTATGLYGPW